MGNNVELIVKLRANRNYETNFADLQLCMLAANTIEEQEQQINGLKEPLYKAGVYKFKEFE